MMARLLPSIFLSGVHQNCQPDMLMCDIVRGKKSLYLRMKAISRISTEKVERFPSMLSSVDIREKSLCMMGNEAKLAGTKLPIWTMI